MPIPSAFETYAWQPVHSEVHDSRFRVRRVDPSEVEADGPGRLFQPKGSSFTRPCHWWMVMCLDDGVYVYVTRFWLEKICSESGFSVPWVN